MANIVVNVNNMTEMYYITLRVTFMG